MSAVKELYLQTKSLVEFIEGPFPIDDDERDQFLQEVDERLAMRDHFIKRLDRHSFSPAEKKLGDELYKLNKQLTTQMERLRVTIQANLTQLKTKKETGLKYENPYEARTPDGVFFDKRIL